MTYDEKLAIRIRKSLKGKRNITEKKMFGGLAFLFGPAGCKTDKALSEWICLGIDYTKTLKK